LIKQETNIKEVELLEDASDILVKQIKPNFKVLGPRFGKDMKLVASAINGFSDTDIREIEQNGEIAIDISGKKCTLQLGDVEISSQDIEGWLVANQGSLTVALDVNITEELREEGIARELVNRIQNLRKDSGFEVTDRIHVQLQHSEHLRNAVDHNLEYIKTETLTEELEFMDLMNNGIDIAFDDIQTKLFIQKN